MNLNNILLTPKKVLSIKATQLYKMSEAKVNINDIEKSVNEVCSEFKKLLTKLVSMIESKSKDPDIDRLKRLIKLCDSEAPTFLLERCQNKLWDSREQIKTRNSDYFLKQLDVSKYIRAGSKAEALQYRLIALIKHEYNDLTVSEVNMVWEVTYDMLKCAAKFKFLTKNYIPDKPE